MCEACVFVFLFVYCSFVSAESHGHHTHKMACLNTLKLEIKTLERIFPKTHDRFCILHASVDELTCRFIGKNGKNYDIHANITVSTLGFVPYLRFFIGDKTLSDCVRAYELRCSVVHIWACVCVCCFFFQPSSYAACRLCFLASALILGQSLFIVDYFELWRCILFWFFFFAIYEYMYVASCACQPSMRIVPSLR